MDFAALITDTTRKVKSGRRKLYGWAEGAGGGVVDSLRRMKVHRPLPETQFLGDTEEKAERLYALLDERLRRVAVTDAGWSALYFDAQEASFWEFTFPESAQHGGGPPQLTRMKYAEAEKKYGPFDRDEAAEGA